MAVHFRPAPGTGGPSWLTFLGHRKDSLWSVDLFRCVYATLRTHWVLVVMDQYTRKIIGFGMHAGIVDGMSLCRMFQQAIRSQPAPEYLSSDNDPLFRFHQWQANLRILEVEEIKTVPYAPLSHPFVERLIGNIRRECLDLTLFWTREDLPNHHRTHSALTGCTPQETSGPKVLVSLRVHRWRLHCGGLYQTPVAA